MTKTCPDCGLSLQGRDNESETCSDCLLEESLSNSVSKDDMSVSDKGLTDEQYKEKPIMNDTTMTTTTIKTYIHTGGQLGDFDFLYDVIEKDKIIKLNERDEWRYDRFKNRHIPSGSELDDALCDFVKMVKDDVIALGYGFEMED